MENPAQRVSPSKLHYLSLTKLSLCLFPIVLRLDQIRKQLERQPDSVFAERDRRAEAEKHGVRQAGRPGAAPRSQVQA